MAAMLPDGRRLGAHLAMATGLVKTAERAVEIGASALQIFSDNPTAWQRRAEPAPDIPAFRAALDANDIVPLAIHGSYLINLAGADDVFHEGSVGLLVAELAAARRFGARFVNIHIGSHRGAGLDAGIERIADGLAKAFAADGAELIESADAPPSPTPVVTLENSAGGGGGLGIDVPELAAIAAGLDRAGIARNRVAFCLDTAHLWGAGVDLADAPAVDRLVRSFADEVGIHRLPLVHLNDTKSELGSRVDRHEHLGAGRIGPDGITAILRHPLLAGTTYIIETPGMDEGYDAINQNRALALARGEPMAPLPPGALTLRGSRSRSLTPSRPEREEAGRPARRTDPTRARTADGS
jgi:deoxyribonuclease IV